MINLRCGDNMQNNKRIVLYYFSRYLLIILIGEALKLLDIKSIYQRPIPIIIIYNLLAILIGIKRPLEKRKDIKYKELLSSLIPLSTLASLFIIYISGPNLELWLSITIINIIELLLLKPKNQIIEDQTQRNIAEYFKNQSK